MPIPRSTAWATGPRPRSTCCERLVRDNMFDLRVQYGIRIGVIISDEITMTFSPIPLLIETGSTAAEKTNAIILSGAPTERIHQSAFLLVQWSQPKRILSKNSEPPFAGR